MQRFGSKGGLIVEETLKEKLLEEAIKTFLEKNFSGGSKSDRDDYIQMVSCKDIYELYKVYTLCKKD